MAKEAEDLAAQAARIRHLRESQHLTQPEVAEGAGVSLRGYQAWEAGDSDPTPRNRKALAAFFGVTPDHIACGHERPRADAPDLAATFNGNGTQLDRIELKLDAVVALLQDLGEGGDIGKLLGPE